MSLINKTIDMIKKIEYQESMKHSHGSVRINYSKDFGAKKENQTSY